MRSLLSCIWIINDQSVLPMHIIGLMKYTDETINEKLKSLIELKASVGERYLHEKNDELNEWILEKFKVLELSGQNLGVSKGKITLLNDFFLKMVNA